VCDGWESTIFFMTACEWGWKKKSRKKMERQEKSSWSEVVWHVYQ
jgi:hypothetical protein